MLVTTAGNEQRGPAQASGTIAAAPILVVDAQSNDGR